MDHTPNTGRDRTRTPTDPQMDPVTEFLDAVNTLQAALKTANGQKKNWIEKNPTLSVAILGAVFAAFQVVGQSYFQANVGKYIEPAMAETKGKLGALEQSFRDEKQATRAVQKTLIQHDADLAIYMLEGDRYDRALLEKVAKKLKVGREERPGELSEAEERVKDVRDGARLGGDAS